MNYDRVRAGRWYRRYNALLSPLVPAIGGYTLWRRYGQKKSAASLHGQWGVLPPELRSLGPKQPGEVRIWLQAVSVGENIAARPILRALKEAIPGARIFLSVTTDTGYETAGAALRAGEVEAVFYFPLDLPPLIKKVLRAIEPDAFLTMETELWPNVLHLAHTSGVQTFVVNGRVSDNLQKRAPQLRWVWRWMVGNIDGFLMRSEYDADRMRKLGAPPACVHVTGDVKLDAVPPGDGMGNGKPNEARERWRTVLGIGEAPFWVAGSTHPGEEELIFKAHQALRSKLPGLRLLLAPRHIERIGEVEDVAEALGITTGRRTSIGSVGAPDDAVVLLDTVGELGEVYAAADAAFVGGSLIPRGGHNMLEPVLRGVPVAFGPHVANFREAAVLVESVGCGKTVQDDEQLTQVVGDWLRDETERRAIAQRAMDALAAHRGAAARGAAIVAERLAQVTGI